ncbi:MAG: gliding motility-associated ABC transporter substrate-binding protein GldG [Bacteroidetes bacterium]|nr:gliding motility-associated ABC transporter substrate-binding protein GldG [Bacteroidota bacterium]
MNIIGFLTKYKYGKGWLILLLLILVNGLANYFPLRLDLTAEKRYSLSSATRTMLGNIEEPISIDILLKGDFPAVFNKLKNSTADLLEEMQRSSNHRLRFQFVHVNEWMPDAEQESLFKTYTDSLRQLGIPIDSILQTSPGFKEEFKQGVVADRLKQLGIMPYNLQVQQKEDEKTQRIIFPSAIVHCKDRIIPIDLLSGKTEYARDPLSGRLQIDEAKSIANAEALLEFQFANAIHKIQKKEKPTVAYLIGNGEPQGPETFELVQALEPDYRLSIFDLNKNNIIPKEIGALLIVKPSIPFSDSAKLKIDQYIMQGGKTFWMLDMLHAEKDSLALQAQTLAYDRNLQLDDLLFKYGVRINRDLIQDLQCDLSKMVVGYAGGQPQIVDVPFNYYPLLQSAGEHAITRNLEPVLSQFVNSIDTIQNKEVRKYILLHSSANSKTISTPAIISLNELKTIENPALYNLKYKPAAVLLEGKFSSLYANRAPGSTRDFFRQQYGSFQTQSPKTAQIVAADGDLVLNSYTSREPFPMGYSRAQEKSFANKTFLENSLEYLTGNADIIALRNKEITVRLLNPQKLAEEKIYWQTILIGLPLLLVVFGWLAFSVWRKKAFGSSCWTKN